jgi:hypothetical protein
MFREVEISGVSSRVDIGGKVTFDKANKAGKTMEI